ncbi:PREDICTED: putative E3 ubiquitin-protein ligase XBAT34 isoform X2 [Camelina sativa]|uniref:E3 ubiquitin-protein ligase XBAT34 isoform X2 n=1 Tax=Camelina sativa TaxID=90675 RepID=A0ABM0UFQ1_CAMSA|nr:PREDICTED: putative E3 ubiquitin-protein ligase XBAT34 isoform X2 [Camelina sativa]XP_019088648.1 PREDICTED: putative E3 ubiquitin-protein ligase XBAT34 isoform X2 [Camelina sativa]
MGQQQSQCKEELLFQQVGYNDVEAIKSLRREGAGLEWVDKLGRTPLISACMNEDLYDVAKTLLQLGSNVNAYRSGSNSGTPLHHAAKRGLVNTVKLLLSNGANPLVLDDNIQTALEVARAKGHSSVVRAIENHTCLFSGWMREFYGPSFLEFFAPDFFSRRVWVVVVPTGSRNLAKPFKLELAVYDSLKDAQPRMEMPLWKANLDEPKPSSQSDDSVMIVKNSTNLSGKIQRLEGAFVSQARRWARVHRQMRLAAETKGDKKQLKWFCEACKGTPQPMNPPMFLQTFQTTSESAPPQSAMNEMPVLNHPAFISQDYLTPSANSEGIKEDGLCVICVDASSEAACVPCGHVAGCVSCLKEIKNKKMGCPVCRAKIDQFAMESKKSEYSGHEKEIERKFLFRIIRTQV